MTGNDQSQLRFDISENVTFHHDQPGIDTLLSLDLVPEVRIEDHGATVRIEGAIRLTGKYLSHPAGAAEQRAQQLIEANDAGEDEAKEDIQYIIPVEITMPSERAGHLDDITAEIQSFDYELVSGHELAIDALLVVDGLRASQENVITNASFAEQEEEAVMTAEEDFVGDREEAGDRRMPKVEEAHPTKREHEAMPELQNEGTGRVETWTDTPEETESLLSEEDLLESEPSFAEAWEQHTVDDEAPATTEESDVSEPEAAAESDGTDELPAEVEEPASAELSDEPTDKQTEKPETKINFQKKIEKQPTESVSLNDLLQSEHSAQEELPPPLADNEAEAVDDAEDTSDVQSPVEQEEEADVPTGEGFGIEWMKQKFGGEEDHFHRLRMVIVQEEDTLEGIADRYDLSSVELLQVNGLESGELEQGQIVYLPDGEKGGG